MATFNYVGIDATGKRVKGLIAADTPRAARDRLRDGGISSIVKLKPQADRPQFDLLSGLRKRRYESALTDFTRELATLLQAGVPLLEAIDCSLPQTRPGLQNYIHSLRDRVASGSSLADAMRQESWLFDPMMVGMVHVGEHAGNLDEVLDQVASFREQSGELKDRVLTAITYPIIVLIVAISVTLFLMTVVVPMLLNNLAELGGTLPWPTKVLKFLSDGLLVHGWWLGLVLGSGMVGFAFWLQTENGRLQSTRFMLRIPILGNLIRKQAIGRAALVIACLLRSGVELVESLSIAAEACSNIVLRHALSTIQSDLRNGANLKESIAKHKIFPSSVSQVFALGQQSGQLPGMLQRLGKDYDRQASVLAGRLTSVAEPVMIVMLSVVVGFILFATVLPILEAGNVLAGE